MRVVAVGGGHGLARALRALRLLDVAPTAVVSVADDGGSSGRLREELGVAPPGDLRRALLALAPDGPLARAVAHRFTDGSLAGHVLGNLLLVALSEERGDDLVAALDDAAAVLGCAGRVLPATTTKVRLQARIAGEDVEGQVRVAQARGRVERVWLDPGEPPACPEAVQALEAADLVVLGPGSLYTSILAALLVPGLADALSRGSARVVLIANLATQRGETERLDLTAHVDALLAHLPGVRLAEVLAHDGPDVSGGGAPLGTSVDHPRVGAVRTADLAERSADGRAQPVHDLDRLAAALKPLVT